jgi:hypothetical protein
MAAIGDHTYFFTVSSQRGHATSIPMDATNLPGDVLVAVVRNGGGAPALVKMLCTCDTWRAVLLAEGGDQLWQTLAMERFPRLRLLLQHAPAIHAFRIIYRQQLEAEHIRHPPPLSRVPPLSAYIFAMEWRADGGVIGSWSGEVTNLNAWLPVQWSGPLEELEQMRKDMRTFSAAAVANESQEEFYVRNKAWCDTSSWDFVKSFTVSLSVMRRSDLATLLLSQPEEEQEMDDTLEEDPLAPQVIRMETQSNSTPPSGSMAYGLIDHWHFESARQDGRFEEREVAEAALRINPVMRIGSSNFADSGVTVDAMALGFQKCKFPAHNYTQYGEVPVTHSEVLRYLAYVAPWPAPVGLSV